MRMKFTERTITSLKLGPGQTDVFFIDETFPGFSLRLRPGIKNLDLPI